MMQNMCFICIETSDSLKTLGDNDDKDIKIVEKLQKCIPEVDWQINYNICPNCLQQLNAVFTFRELCINSYLSRKNIQNWSIPRETDETLTLQFDSNQINSVEDNSYFNASQKSNTLTSNGSPAEISFQSTSIDFICYHCRQSFKLKNSLLEHISGQHPKNIDKIHDWDNDLPDLTVCRICGTSFRNKYLLNRHVRNVHATEKKFTCDICERKFASVVYLNAHKNYHSRERKHICSFCGKGYITTSDLYHHEKIHTNKRAYRCECCPKAFNTSSDLHKHKMCVHSDRSNWKYECTLCQKKFPLKTNLDNHLKTHTGERNFLCNLCEYRCINKSVLKRHLETHSVVKSHKCNICLFSYKSKRSLDYHLLKIHGIGDVKLPERTKKFCCTMCSKSFYDNNKLQKHIRVHTGEKPFSCQICDKRFIDKTYVKHHVQNTHGNLLELNIDTRKLATKLS